MLLSTTVRLRPTPAAATRPSPTSTTFPGWCAPREARRPRSREVRLVAMSSPREALSKFSSLTKELLGTPAGRAGGELSLRELTSDFRSFERELCRVVQLQERSTMSRRNTASRTEGARTRSIETMYFVSGSSTFIPVTGSKYAPHHDVFVERLSRFDVAYAARNVNSTRTASNGKTTRFFSVLSSRPAWRRACTSPCTAFTSPPARGG